MTRTRWGRKGITSIFKLLLALILSSVGAGSVEAATISGTVTDAESGETLPYANCILHVDGTPIGVLTNVDGYYAIKNAPEGRYEFIVSFVGYASFRDTVELVGDEALRIDADLRPVMFTSEEIVVEADRYEEEELIQTGFIAFPTEKIEQLPAIGETDLLRSLVLLPGIQASSDISTGLYVRGGGLDQTLILLDQIPLYNPSHAFGFFSTFNADAIKDMSLHKGAYPAQYGGRLGAVLDVRNRDGNRRSFEARGGVSLIAARTTLEGPVGNGSWMISGRRTYLEPLLSAIRTDSTDIPSYYFYDLNAKLNHDFGNDDKLTVSGYFGRDDLNFDLEEDTYFNIRWGNTAGTAKWTHLFSPTVFGNFVVAGSKYTSTTDLSIFDTPILFKNSITDLSLKADVDYFATSHHTITAGTLSTFYDFSFRQIFNQEDQLDLSETPSLISLYAQDHWQPRAGTSIRFGARANYFSEEGGVRVEPRISVSHLLKPKWRAKIGGGSYAQYLQLVTTEAFSGGDFWVPLDSTVDPGEAIQGVAGIEYQPSLKYKFSVEGYYTNLANLLVIDQNVPVDSDNTTTEDVFVTGGEGYATGAEVFLQKRTGKLTGWIGYTLGWTRRKFGEVNEGETFAPKYDRRHDLSVVASYAVGKWTLGANFVYATGQAFTPASARYGLRSPAEAEFPPDRYALPAGKNSGRLLPYHRADLNVKRKFGLFGGEAEWYVQVFNAYNRRNEWFVEFDDGGVHEPKVFKMLPIIPTVGIDFHF